MSFVRLLFICVLLHATSSTRAQSVSFTAEGVSLTDVFSIIKKQTGVLFFYDAALLQDTKPVSVKLNNVPLETALNEIFKEQNLSWVLEEKTVTIVKNPFQKITPKKEATARELSGLVKGKITDREGKPINGVSVLVKGTGQGTTSNEAGKFSIAADQKNILSFSSVNYSSRELRVMDDEMNIVLELDLKPLEAMVVGGNLNAIKRRAEANSITVLDAKTLAKIPTNTLDQVFRGWVPGVYSFNVGPEAEGFPNISIRGATSVTSLSGISVYIDGVEYAGGTGYLAQLDKNNIERIEIVKGPGAATLYGTGSNGGIIQIFTKKPEAGQTTLDLSTAAGFYKSKWVSSDAFQQVHNLETTTGFKRASLKLGGSYRTVGAYLPEGGEKNKGFYGSVKLDLGKLQANITGRYNEKNYHRFRNPLYDTTLNPRTDIIIEPFPGYEVPAYIWFNTRPRASINKDVIVQTTIAGINLSHQTRANWINSLDAGYTRNNGREIPTHTGLTPLQTSYFAEESQIITARYSNVLRLLKPGNDFGAVITTGAEYKKFSAYSSVTRTTAARTSLSKEPDNENYGAFAQVSPSYKNVYLNMGLRYEKNNLFKAAWNPRLGLTTNFDAGFLIVKPRISWGKGINRPTYTQRYGHPPNSSTVIYPNPDLKAQSQQGFDYAVELYDKKGRFKFEVVYYDNLLKDMIGEEVLGQVPGDTTLSAYIYKNVGEVINRGWEFLSEYKTTRFGVRANLSIMNSSLGDTTGAHLFDRYTGKPPGTRLIYLPKYTGGLSLDYNFFKLFRKADKGFISLNVTASGGVKYFDSRTYILDVSYGRTPYDPGKISDDAEGGNVFRVGLYLEYTIIPELKFFTLGSNILNDYRYEFYHDYPTHGATWLFGFKYNFTKK